MRTRFGIAALVAVVLALPITAGLASANPDPVGKAALYQTGSSGVSGAAFVVRQLTSNQTHVMLRLSGVKAKTPVVWQIVGGAYCGSAPTSTLMTQFGSSTAS